MSMETDNPKFPATPIGQMSLLDMDDDSIVRAVITEAIKRSEKSREEIAEEMQTLMGRRVTERMLKAFTADSKELHRFPLAFTRAFCHVVGDQTLLRVIVEKAGLGLMTPEDVAFARLGRSYFLRDQASDDVANLKSQIGKGASR
jgi:hypothetical protein